MASLPSHSVMNIVLNPHNIITTPDYDDIITPSAFSTYNSTTILPYSPKSIHPILYHSVTHSLPAILITHHILCLTYDVSDSLSSSDDDYDIAQLYESS
jgi:hypothetical protein